MCEARERGVRAACVDFDSPGWVEQKDCVEGGTKDRFLDFDS
jgi:hypothetical protein